MLNKKLSTLLVSVLVILISLNFISAGTININPSPAGFGDIITVSIDYPNYATNIYIFDLIGRDPLKIFDLNCGEIGCYGRKGFSSNASEMGITTLGTYQIAIYSITDNMWFTQNFQIYDEFPLPETCSDGTPYGQCSTTKPKFCYRGGWQSRCDLCGCPSGLTCLPSGLCSACFDGTLFGQCSVTKPMYCDNGNLINKCQTCPCPNINSVCQADGTCSVEIPTEPTPPEPTINCGDRICSLEENCNTCEEDCGCSQGYRCQTDGICKIFYAFPVGANTKDTSLYSSKEVFLVSDKNWKNVLPFVPAAVWTEGSTIKKYPFLIYHEDYVQSITHDRLLMEKKIHNGNYDIEDEIIAYYGLEGISVYDTLTGINTVVSSNSPRGKIILSNKKMIWAEIGDDDESFNIFLYNIPTRMKSNLFTNSEYLSGLSFLENKIAWGEEVGRIEVGEGYTRGIFNIYLYDVSTGIKTLIASNVVSGDEVVISNEFLLWNSAEESDTEYLPYLNIYNLLTEQITKVQLPKFPAFLSISGNRVVYSIFEDSNFNVFVYDVSTGQERRITSNDASDYYPRIFGNKIVWQRGGNIYMYDLQTEQETAITESVPYEDAQKISGDKIVFCRDYCDLGLSVYDNMILNEEVFNNFDADSIIYFMQQYSPDKVTIIGETPQDLDNLLVTQPDFGVGLSEEKIQRIKPGDYLAYWTQFNTIVYVQDNYEFALLASTYASLINSPLIIEGTELDSSDAFFGRDVICVGDVNPSGSYCKERYKLEQLQQKYKTKTNTDKVILVNPDDWTVSKTEELKPIKSLENYKLYTKTSLSASILASARQELIISTKKTNYENIDAFLEPKLTKNLKYLTIVAAPNVIPDREYEFIAGPYDIYRSLDATQYADVNNDLFPDIAVGRIMGITSSDVSSYLARDLFYDSFTKTNSMKFMVSSFLDEIEQATRWSAKFNEIGHNANLVTSETSCYNFQQSEWENNDLISYQDHGSHDWAGISSSQIPLLKNSIIFNDACSTCSTYDSNSFCNNAIRRGGIAHTGAVSVAFTGNRIYMETMNGIYHNDLTIGEAFKKSFDYYKMYYETYLDSNYYNYYYMIILLGDPVFDLKPEQFLSKALCYGGDVEDCNNIDDDCDGEIDEGCDDDNDNFCDPTMRLTGIPTTCIISGTDCDDGNANINPGKNEICNNIDDDCDGEIDEGDVCSAGVIGCTNCNDIPPTNLYCSLLGDVKGQYYKCRGIECVLRTLASVVEDCQYGCSEQGQVHCMTAEEKAACQGTKTSCGYDSTTGTCTNCGALPPVLYCGLDILDGHIQGFGYHCGNDRICHQDGGFGFFYLDCGEGCSETGGTHCKSCVNPVDNINCGSTPTTLYDCQRGNLRTKAHQGKGCNQDLGTCYNNGWGSWQVTPCSHGCSGEGGAHCASCIPNEASCFRIGGGNSYCGFCCSQMMSGEGGDHCATPLPSETSCYPVGGGNYYCGFCQSGSSYCANPKWWGCASVKCS